MNCANLSVLLFGLLQVALTIFGLWFVGLGHLSLFSKRPRQAQKAGQQPVPPDSRPRPGPELPTAAPHGLNLILTNLDAAATDVVRQVHEFRIDQLAYTASLLRQHAESLADFLLIDPRGRQLPEYLAVLASHLRAQQTLILKELASLQAQIAHLKGIAAAPHSRGQS